MQRYRVNLAYDGTNYAGWQSQLNANTIQDVMEVALSKIWHEKIRLVGCGRTDAGVHALSYWAHFDAVGTHPEYLVKKVNANLPPSISLIRIEKTHSQWHARFDATSRTYQYLIAKERDPLQPFQFPYYYFDLLEIDLLNKAALTMANHSQFKTFCKTRSDVSHYRCQIHHVLWEQVHETFTFTIQANRFLRGMVRLMVGACIHVALGKIDLTALDRAIARQIRLQPSWSVPAQGLILTEVHYSDE